MLNMLRARATRRQFIARLQDQIVARAREKVFFREFSVPDTMDGRFDLMVLHAWLVLERLNAAGMGDVAQVLTDEIFVSFDDALREQGTGDMGMGRRMKAMAGAFHGRLKAYSDAADEAALGDALMRNIFRGKEVDARPLARYAGAARIALTGCALDRGELDFGPLPVLP